LYITCHAIDVETDIMKLQQLRQFVALAETLNFHRAAERLHMAQPPLSISFRKLEEELGTALFLRGSRGLTLTPAGEAALVAARQALVQTDRVQRVVRETISGGRGELRLGFVGSAAYQLLPALLRGFRAEYPQIEISLQESRTAELLTAIDAGTIDAAIVRTPLLQESDAAVFPLVRDHLDLAVAHESRFARRKKVDLGELRDEPFVVYGRDSVPSMHAITMLACQQAGFVPRIVQEAGQSQTIICLVESQYGVALVPRVIGRHNSAVAFVGLRGRAGQVPTGLALTIGSSQPPVTAVRFRDFAVAQMAENDIE
jgi:DNA-binding transcriptional LysR family regulator